MSESRLYRPRRPGQGRCGGAIVHLEAVPLLGLHGALDRDGGLEHRHLDARGRCRLADDLAGAVAVHGGAGPGSNDATDLPAGAARGALADIVDRRKVLRAVTLFLTVVAAALGGLVWLGLVRPGCCWSSPSSWALGRRSRRPPVGDRAYLVPRADLQPAVALNSVGINISRAIGPALGGLIIATLGIAVPFLLNAVGSLGVIAALLWWQPPVAPAPSPPCGAVLPVRLDRSALRPGERAVAGDARPCGRVLFVRQRILGTAALIARGLLSGGLSSTASCLAASGPGRLAKLCSCPSSRRCLIPTGWSPPGRSAWRWCLLSSRPSPTIMPPPR